MPSLGSILNIASTGLRAQQQAMNVVAHNLANASTEGYARQRAVIAAASPLRTYEGVFGTGVTVVDVERIADPLLDGVYQRERALASENETRNAMLGRVETVLAEPSELGLGAALDAFFSSWSELASNPGSTTVRSVLRQRASELAGRFQTLAGNLDSIRQETETRLQLAVEEVTSMASNVADLNQQIVSIEADGTTAGDLRDARARLLDRMSELVPIQVSHRDNGSVGVTVAGVSIVDGANSSTVKVVVSGGVTGLGIEGRTGLFQDTGGSTGALIDLINTDLPTARQRLDDLAEALVTEVNTLHAGGTTPDGSTGVNFFDASATAASTIALSTEVRADVDAIAAGTADASGGYRAGANDVAEPVAALRDTVVASVGDTISESFRGLVSDIGEAVRSSTDAAEAHGVLAEQARLRRESLGGVSVDEELVRMIQFQTGYQAAARVVTAADEMLQSLLAI